MIGFRFNGLGRVGTLASHYARATRLEEPMPSRREMTRKQLHKLVWSQPMRDAAATIPMSDVGLKKVCRRHGVPVPPQGYWNKVHAGHRVKTKALPPAKSDQPETFEILAPAPLHGAVLESKKQALARAVEAAKLAPPEPTSEHECTARTRAALEKLQPDRRGALRLLGEPGVADILLWPEQLERGLSLLNRLCYAVERAGYRMALSRTSPAAIAVGNEKVRFQITAHYARREQKQPPAEKWDWRKSGIGKALESQSYEPWRQWVFVPSGTLKLSLSGSYNAGLRCNWSDGISRRIDDQLPQVMAEIAAHAASLREKRLAEERRAAAAEEAARRREEAERIHRREGERRAFLEKRASAYARALELREFAAHLRATSRKHGSAALSAFLQWADAHIQGLLASSSARAVHHDLTATGLFDDD